ncbi:TonB-dependent receptor [Croceivirga thetidis]|uniref:TonB-dependent receptor n=1 Tax=Croceivirga thetidis TaxID=2721623 RepID=A0ABX1GNM3_9FLAO|nr:TonB-dependent receptor [Croceivirga thetidis]NKI31531.1 TonB-dependent receptor [Croceivirga thetidis]
MKNQLLLVALVLCQFLVAQTGTIKGIVLDKQSEVPLMGATIELLDQAIDAGVVTNEDGRFTITDVPTGRQKVRVSYIGYESLTLPNIEVTTGKDVALTIMLLESFNQLDEIVVTTNTNKDRANNKLATVSARQFGVEEVTRFSGGRSDVGRLAANFAGVSSPDDSRNDIVVRGNSPTGLLWRVEGIPVPNPNHFSTVGTTGGPVSAVNPNTLKNSDFLTSAFASEYGNALGGVFDLGIRKGNVDDHEFSGQVGIFTGIEANAEGPLGKKDGSFLVAARYSLIGLIGAGAGGTAATPNYSDLTYNIDFGRGNLGRISLFGMLGNSDIDFLGDSIDEGDLFAAEDEDTFVKSGFGVLGIKHQLPIGDNSYLRTIVATSYSSNEFTANRYFDLDTPEERRILFTESEDSESRLSFSTLFNSKLSNKATLRFGALIENFNVELATRDRNEQPDNDGDGDPDLFTFLSVDENFALLQPYIQTQIRLTEKLTFDAGIHSQYSSLNEQFVIEPRAALNFQLAPNHKVNFGYGLHHQNVPFPLLFLNEEVNGSLVQTNRNLDFVRSNHYVLGYDVKLGNDWRGKIEVYNQEIDNAAVESSSSSYSSLTEGANFGFSNDKVSLVNTGTGFNRGIEFTLEKFFSNNYYGLLTGSFFESKYEGSDGVERNSPFNNGYVINALAGREFPFGNQKNKTIFVDSRISFAGGRYFTPVDLPASQQVGFEVLQDDLAFSQQYDGYFRWDFKIGLKINSRNKKQSHRFYVDLQNVTANENVFVQRFNRLTNQVDQVNQIGFFPDFGYKFQF